MSYVNLINVKSCYNFLESTIKIEDYINFSKRNNLSYVFYTDKNYMYGMSDFFKLAQEQNLKPIAGVEFSFDSFSIILYAKNNEGYKIISSLSSNYDYYEKLDKNDFKKLVLNKLNDNLITIFIPNNSDAESIYKKLQTKQLDLFIGVNKKNNLNVQNSYQWEKIIWSNPVQTLNEEEYVTLRVLDAIKKGVTVDQITDLENNFYITEESLEKFININNHNESFRYIVENCNFNLFENNRKHFLKFENKEKINSDIYIEKLCEAKLKQYAESNEKITPPVLKEYEDRMYYELSVIKKMNFEDYFLIVADMISEARKRGILVGPGRGSAAGSLVSFLLKITQIDPLEHNLLFERFLNPERVTMPDIDIDFQDNRRNEIIEYLFEKYGAQHFATISTFQTIGIRNALRDCGRVLNIPLEDVNAMTKLISAKNTNDLQLALEESKTLKEYKIKHVQLFKIVENIIGLPRQTGTHAAGVVFCDEEINEIVPVKVGINGVTQTQFPMNHLETLGLIKTDILGLRNLSVIQEVLDSIKKSRNISIKLSKISQDDKETYEILKKGETTGIFQLESPGMTDVLMKMNPKSIIDIANTSALYRPGPQENIPQFLERKKSDNHDYVIDESIKDELYETYGIIVYQEQVMNILKKVGGMSLSKADIVRRAMGKKDIELMHKLQNEFIEGAMQNGFSEVKAYEIWNYIEKFASYGFNKSHAIAYSLIGYWMAYLKTHFKEEFYCALLNGVIRNEEKTSTYIREVKNARININPPSIKNPNAIYYWDGNKINVPLSVVKYIGPEFLKNLKEIFKNQKNNLDNLFSLMGAMYQKGINEQTYDALVYSGAFDVYGYSRKQMIEEKEFIFNTIHLKSKDIKLGDAVDFDIIKEPNKPEDVIAYEKDYLGFYITTHPLTILRTKIPGGDRLVTLNNLNKDSMIGDVLVLIDNISIKNDKNGNEMAFIDISDETGSIPITVFSSSYETLKSKINLGDKLILKVKTQIFNSKLTGVLQEYIKKID